MEHAPFSEAGLVPGQLEKEAEVIERSINAVQEAVKEIDLQTVDDILLSIFKKVYPDRSEDDLKSRFLFDGNYNIGVKYSEKLELENYNSKRDLDASAYARGNKIAILARAFVDNAGSLDKHSRSDLVKTVIHEIMHTKSSNFDQYHQVEFSGVSLEDGQIKEEGNPYIHLNEALTEVVADAVYSEYLARTGTAKEFDEERNGYTLPIERHAAYMSERLALEQLARRLAKESGMSLEQVYQAFAVEYFKNGDLGRGELLELIDSEEIKSLLGKIEVNDTEILTSFSPAEIAEYDNYLHWYQQKAVTGLVGRDYISSVNRKRDDERRKLPTNLQKLWEFLKNNF
jgi:hypothetical protein